MSMAEECITVKRYRYTITISGTAANIAAILLSYAVLCAGAGLRWPVRYHRVSEPSLSGGIDAVRWRSRALAGQLSWCLSERKARRRAAPAGQRYAPTVMRTSRAENSTGKTIKSTALMEKGCLTILRVSIAVAQ